MAEIEMMEVRSTDGLASRLVDEGLANPQFCEVPPSVWKTRLAKRQHYVPMFDKEAIHLKEMRGFVKAVRGIADRMEN